MVKIPLELLHEILYFINDWLRLMGYGSEHRRLSRLIWHLALASVFKNLDTSKYHYVNAVIKEFQRIQKIEENK